MDKSSFNMFPRILDKIIQDEAHAVILVPKWRKHKFFWRAWGLAVDAVMVPKGTVMFKRKGKVQKWVPWDVYAFLVCGHVPPCLPSEVRGLPTPSLPPIEEEGGPEDEKWPEASPTQIANVMAISDPCWETPQGQTKFDLAKWGMVLPPWEGSLALT